MRQIQSLEERAEAVRDISRILEENSLNIIPEGKVAVPIKDGLKVLAVPLANHDEDFARMLLANKPEGAEAYDERIGESYHVGERTLTVHAVQYFKFRDVTDYIEELKEIQIPFERGQ